ncbi:D-alanyl-D-alanine endopeptidase [Uliginosibacterium sp. H3]|uniref:D-alanyl-D-alanine endopeptidase n=1 Tax=Uliginosibacterium silvisoli TaxID=3114758 RepID=A0ABU6K5Y0_9RHOO|nr:D-alanyl-D-alanine endopeptidase [Uliginosibacterium sp. H3]
MKATKATRSSAAAPRVNKVVFSRTTRTKNAVTTTRKTVYLPRAVPDFDREGNPLLKSSAFIVQDMDSGQVLLEKNASLAQPIASISKLMTAMVVLDANLDLTEMLQITDDDVDRLKGTSSHLPVGTRLTREDMLRLALMASENRAASALSRFYPGGHSAFIQAMNDKAKALGLSETRFYDSIGLNRNNVASARDLVAMTTAASHYPLIREFSTTAEYSVPVSGRERAFHNTNALVRNSDWQINLSKTGYINESGKCLVMQVVLANKRMAIILLDSSGRFTRVADAIRIRKWVETAVAPARIASVSTLSKLN